MKKFKLCMYILNGLFTLIAVIVCLVLVGKINDIFAIIGVIIIMIIGIISHIYSWKMYNNYHFEINQEFDTIDIYKGVVFKSIGRYPIRRIQNVRLVQNIIQKQFNISTIIIIDGGQSTHIEYVDYQEAQVIVEKITNVLNRKLDEI